MHHTPQIQLASSHKTSVPRKPAEIHWLRYDNTVPSLNSVKTNSATGRKIFKCTSISSDSLPVGLP